MSVGIFKNGKYNKVAGNAKDSTATNTTYNNGTSGLQANNVQSAIDELDSTVDTLNSNLKNFSIVESGSTNSQVVFNPIKDYTQYAIFVGGAGNALDFAIAVFRSQTDGGLKYIANTNNFISMSGGKIIINPNIWVSYSIIRII